MTRRACLGIAIASMSTAACGGSGSSSASSNPGPGASTTGSASSATTTSASSSAAVTRSTASASGSPTPSSTSAAARARNGDIRVPAAFAIGAGGSLAPPLIAVPKQIDIELILTSNDGKSHTFELNAPHEYHATVRPGAPTRALLNGIPAGTYSVAVDHRVAGRLIVGVAPGP